MFNVTYFLVGILVNIIAIFVNSVKFTKIVEYQGGKLSVIHSFYNTNIYHFMNYLLPFKASVLLIRPYFTKKMSNLSLSKSIYAVYFEQVLEMFWQVIIAFALLIFVGNLMFFHSVSVTSQAIIFFLLFILVYWLIVYTKLPLRILLNLFKLLPKYLKRRVERRGVTSERIESFLKDISQQLRNYRLLIKLAPLTIFYLILIPLLLYIAAGAFGFSLTYPQVFIAYWASALLARFSFLPGLVGLKDVGMGAMLVVFGIPMLDSVKVVFLYRIIAAVPHTLFSLVYLINAGSLYLLRRGRLKAELEGIQ